MSQRSIKRRVARLLADRDYADKLIAAYDAVIADLGEPVLGALVLGRAAVLQRRNRAQAEAEELAGQLSKPKQTFSGRWLHRGGEEVSRG